LRHTLQAFEAMRVVISPIMEMKKEEYNQLLIEVENECNELTMHKKHYRVVVRRNKVCGLIKFVKKRIHRPNSYYFDRVR
jgi:hypothetical protein